MMVRRMSVLACAVLVLAGLGACTDRSVGDAVVDDSLVAEVGEVQITQEQVEAVVADLRRQIGSEIEGELAELAEDVDEQALADHRERRYGELEDQVTVTRARIIEMWILTEAAAMYLLEEELATEEELVPGEQERAVVADDLGLPPENAYVGVVTRFFMHMNRLQAHAEPAEPTDDDLREVYDHLLVGDKPPFSEARDILMQAQIQEPLGMRNLLIDVLDRAAVTVSPDHRSVYQVPVQVGRAESWVGVPVGEG